MKTVADTKVWGIHTKDDNLFLKENVVAIGWNEMGDISDIQSDREKLKQKFPLVYPNKKPGGCMIVLMNYLLLNVDCKTTKVFSYSINFLKIFRRKLFPFGIFPYLCNY